MGMRQVEAGPGRENERWLPISSAPFDRDLELAVIGYNGVHALAFPAAVFWAAGSSRAPKIG
jgi:hypothetical protein